MKNKSLLLWIFIVISVVSTSALLTVVLLKPAFYSNERPPFHQFNDNQNFQRKSMMEILNLDENQKELFMQEKQKHHVAIMPIFDSIMTTRARMFTELRKEIPDTENINIYILNISQYEARLQMESVYHLLNMKSFLNEVQIDSMFSIFSRRMMPGHPTQHSRRGNSQKRCR